MCFIIDAKHSEEKIAKKDIVCYKRLMISPTGNFLSPYQLKPYKLNILCRSKLELSSYNTICVGIHSYSCKKKATSCLNRVYFEVLAKGIIPKGSRYYYNPIRHEYVSNRIILKEII